MEKALLKGLRVKETEVKKKLNKYFEEKVEELGDSLALVFEDEKGENIEMTYNELNKTANRIANKILKLLEKSYFEPNKDGDWLIGICMKPSINLITTMLAAWKIGAAYLPLDFSFSDERVEYILDESQPVLIIYDNELSAQSFFQKAKNRLEDLMSCGRDYHNVGYCHCIVYGQCFKFDNILESSNDFSEQNIDEKNTLTKGDPRIAIVLYTTGALGRQKVFEYRLEWYWEEYPFFENESHLIFKCPTRLIDHVGEIWSTLLAGKILVIIPEEVAVDSEKLVPILEKFDVHRLISMPSFLAQILTFLASLENNKTKNEKKLSNIKLWISSGDILSINLANNFFDYFNNDGQHMLANFYGTTEVMADVSTFLVKSKEELENFESFPIGKPSHNTIIYILNDRKEIVKEGETGEIYVSGNFVTDGYVMDHTHKRFTRNPFHMLPVYWDLYRTGDFGKVLNGLLFFEGRHDTQIKVEGNRVELNELENILNSFIYVERCLIQLLNRNEKDQVILAFVTFKRSYAHKKSSDIEEDLRLKIPIYMMPQIILLSQFPYFVSGKINVRELMKSFKQKTLALSEAFQVDMDLENVPYQKLEIVEKIFFLTVIIFLLYYYIPHTILCINQLRKQKFYVSLRDFFDAKDIGEIIEKIESQQVSQNHASLLEIPAMEDLHIEPLNHQRRNECVNLLATGLCEKGILENFLVSTDMEEYSNFLKFNWALFVDNEISFMVLDNQEKIVGISLNIDVEEGPEISSERSSIQTIIKFMEFVQDDIISEKNNGRKVLETFMMATSISLDAFENICIVHLMENHILTVAKERNFDSIITTSTNDLKTEICEKLLGYEQLKAFQLNLYIDSYGKSPFSKAQDSQKTITMWKNLQI
ncbi:CLUMA_CG008433, isoform A [Clunio marinus]|uniref:CLUMA_CG008433, isoform A n=1 Tax=Clunio marinus TaxID=568069 RepID=A0A1J1I3M7_9DIPT|nr:CLUMA_CG008433, isoform A [Clunio marinus]